MATCPECGLPEETISPPDAKVAIRSYPRRFRALLTSLDEDEHPDALVRRRPEPSTWSALEHTAHVADRFGILADVIRRMTFEDHPSLTLPDPDQRAAAGRYNEQETAEVLDRLRANAERLAEALDAVPANEWQRTATFPWGERSTLAMARAAVHEGHHHLRDAERVLSAVRGRPTREP